MCQNPKLEIQIPIDPTTPHSNPLVTMLAIHVNNQNRSAYHQIPLLLPAAGRSFTKSRRTNTIDLIYHSIDMLPQDFDHATINHATGLTIPLQTIVYTPAASTFKFPTKFRSMIADDVFHLHPTHRFLHWKDPADSSLAPWNPAPANLSLVSNEVLFVFSPSSFLCTSQPQPPQ
ncbi:hypothetical protein V8B55DRAFT_1572166 [Mucor lusitanicus]